MTGIYQIKNTINSKCYIGVSIDIEQRWKQHISALKKNKHCNKKLQNAWNKYGAESFQFITLETCNYIDCFSKEIEYIKYFNSYEDGYNETHGGDRGGSEWWEKDIYRYDIDGKYIDCYCSISEAARSLQMCRESIRDIALLKFGHKSSKCPLDNQYYQFRYEYFDSIEPLKKNNVNAKKIYAFDSKNNCVMSFDSISKAYQYYSLTSSHTIQDVLNKSKKWHDLYWSDNPKFIIQDNQGKIVAYINNIEVARAKSALQLGKILSIDNSTISKAIKNNRICKINGHEYVFKKEN